MELLVGKFPPDEEDEDWWKRYGMSLVTYQFMGLPILREAVNYAAFPGRSFGQQIPAFTGLDIGFKAAAAPFQLANDLASDNEVDVQRALWAWADMLSFSVRVPASRVAEKLAEGWRQADAWEDDLNGFEEAMHVLFPDYEKRGKRE